MEETVRGGVTTDLNQLINFNLLLMSVSKLNTGLNQDKDTSFFTKC